MNTPEARVERGPVAQNEPFAIGMAKLLERENRTVSAAELRRLHAQRDALLEALKRVLDRFDPYAVPGYETNVAAEEKARAAISKVEGEQT